MVRVEVFIRTEYKMHDEEQDQRRNILNDYYLHGSPVVDFPFPLAIRDELVSRGKVSPHHHLPDSGWVSF